MPPDQPEHHDEEHAEDTQKTPRASDFLTERTAELEIHDDYFAPPLPPRPQVYDRASSQLLTAGRTAADGGAAPRPLQGTATTAISLPEGVYAQQQDGITSNSGSASGSASGSVTAAASGSDAHSVKSSTAPTLETTDHDMESMLGEILSETEGVYSVAPSEADDSAEDSDEAEIDEDSLPEEEQLIRWRQKKKHFFILSAAGKPVYSRHGSESLITSSIGVIQAIISFFADAEDTLHSFTSGSHLFVVLASGPLYLVAISALHETPAQLKVQLECLYNQVLSTLTLPQLTKAFAGRYNFDLRRLLGGTEVFLDGLVDEMSAGSPGILLSALECVKLRKTHREKLNTLLMKSRAPSLLYGLLLADHRLISVIRPKRHSLYPPDLQLLFSMLFNASTFRDGGEHWTPMCMPRFNSRGYLHAYIHFFHPEVCLVLISANKDAFFELREMGQSVLADLNASGVMPHIEHSLPRYTVPEILPSARILHFLFKSRQNVQYTQPRWSDQWGDGRRRRRVMGLYARLHAAVHERGRGLKMAYVCGGREEGLAWVGGRGEEVYVVGERGVGKEGLVMGVRGVVGWGRAEGERIFVIGGATF